MYAEMKEDCEPVVYSDVVRHSGGAFSGLRL